MILKKLDVLNFEKKTTTYTGEHFNASHFRNSDARECYNKDNSDYGSDREEFYSILLKITILHGCFKKLHLIFGITHWFSLFLSNSC